MEKEGSVKNNRKSYNRKRLELEGKDKRKMKARRKEERVDKETEGRRNNFTNSASQTWPTNLSSP